MRRSLVTIVTAGFLALGSGCSNFLGDSDTDQSQKPATEAAASSNVASGMDRPYSAAQYESMLINVLRQAEAHGVTFEKDVTGNVVARGTTIPLKFPKGMQEYAAMTPTQAITLGNCILGKGNDGDKAELHTVSVADCYTTVLGASGSQAKGPAEVAAPLTRAVAEATRTQSTTWFEHFKHGLTEGDTVYKHMSVKDSDPNKRKLSGTFPSGNGVVIVCSAFIPGPPGKGKEPPTPPPECTATGWIVHPLPPNNYNLALDAYNNKIAGKTFSIVGAGSVDALVTRIISDSGVVEYAGQSVSKVDNAYKQLPRGHMVEGDTLSDDATTIMTYNHTLPTLSGVQAQIRSMVTNAVKRHKTTLDTYYTNPNDYEGSLTITLVSPNVSYRWQLRSTWSELHADKNCKRKDPVYPEASVLNCPSENPDCRADKRTPVDTLMYVK